MGTGKIASQAGHAYVEAILQAQAADPQRFISYRANGLGTKVCLAVDHEATLRDVQAKCQAIGIPTALITDSGCANFFNGAPTVTALGVGPAKKHEIKKILGRFSLVK